VIYLFYGSDVERVRGKAFLWVAAARKKQPELSFVRLSGGEITQASLQDAASAGGLFVHRALVLLDEPFFTDSPIEDELDALAASENAIVIIAPKLLAAKAKKVAAKAAKAYEFILREKKEGRGFNVALTEALAKRSCERLWLEVVRALRAGDAPEMIHGLLHWKARAIRSPELSLALITLLMESRRKGLDLSASLEKFALSINSLSSIPR
jgi:hypothetical protein